LRRPLWISVILLGVLAEVAWIRPPEAAGFLIAGAAETALVIVWLVVFGKIMALVCARLAVHYPGSSELFRLIENVGMVCLGIMGVLVSLTIWEVNLPPLVASAGLAGIIVALAAKDALGNFFGGISLFLDRPFKRGDYIVLNSGERGQVVDIGLRSTRILTLDDVLVSVPNSIMVNGKIVNESAPSRRMRVRVKLSVAYSSDVDQVKQTLLKVANANPLVLPEPKPRVRFRAFGESALDFELLCWTAHPKDKGRLVDQLNSGVFKEFNVAGIVFPLPQRDIYVHQVMDNRAS